MTKNGSKYAFDRKYYVNKSRSMSYDGNAARKLQVAEEDYENEREYEDAVYAAESQNEVKVYSREEKALRPKRVVSIDALYAVIFCVVMTCLLYYSYDMLKVRSDIIQTEKQIVKATNALNDVNALNESLMSGLDTEINRNYIYSVAVGRLGMVYPNMNQVVFYNQADSDYVRQYSVIK